jgi:hypothetical protein
MTLDRSDTPGVNVFSRQRRSNAPAAAFGSAGSPRASTSTEIEIEIDRQKKSLITKALETKIVAIFQIFIQIFRFIFQIKPPSPSGGPLLPQ